jgi:hypothetical protein
MLGVAISPLVTRENEMPKVGDRPFENSVKKNPLPMTDFGKNHLIINF